MTPLFLNLHSCLLSFLLCNVHFPLSPIFQCLFFFFFCFNNCKFYVYIIYCWFSTVESTDLFCEVHWLQKQHKNDSKNLDHGDDNSEANSRCKTILLFAEINPARGSLGQISSFQICCFLYESAISYCGI